MQHVSTCGVIRVAHPAETAHPTRDGGSPWASLTQSTTPAAGMHVCARRDRVFAPKDRPHTGLLGSRTGSLAFVSLRATRYRRPNEVRPRLMFAYPLETKYRRQTASNNPPPPEVRFSLKPMKAARKVQRNKWSNVRKRLFNLCQNVQRWFLTRNVLR